MNFRIEYLESVVRKDIPKLSALNRKRLRQAIEERLGSNPLELGRPLQYSLKGCRRLRVGDYRVIYRIEENDVVLIIKIGHRREVYD